MQYVTVTQQILESCCKRISSLHSCIFIYHGAVVSRHVYGGACSVIVFRDVNTPQPFVEDLSQYGDDGRSQRVTSPDHVYVDAMGFGMGCSCLQVTFQACNINEARHLYDQLTPLTPVLVSRVHHRFFSVALIP